MTENRKVCRIESCERAIFCRNWCSAHYFRWKRTGSTRADDPVRDGVEERGCDVDGCERRHYAQGMCEKHYRRWRRKGDVADPPCTQTCSVTGCDRPASSRGWCHAHYQRWRRHGSVLQDIPLRGEQDECLVHGCAREVHAQGTCRSHHHRRITRGDLFSDVPIGELEPPVSARRRQSRGWITSGYRYVRVAQDERHLSGGKPYEAEHRLVMARTVGRPLRDDENVHHRSGDRTDNRPENLELWSTSQPSGQRISDKIIWAFEILERYAPDHLA